VAKPHESAVANAALVKLSLVAFAVRGVEMERLELSDSIRCVIVANVTMALL